MGKGKTQSNIIGVDIGDFALKLVELEGSVIVKAVSAPLPDGFVRSGEIPSKDSMSDFIAETAKSSGIHKGKCALSMPDSMAYFKTITVPAMTEQQLKYNLAYEFRDYVTEDKSQYFYDYAVQDFVTDENGDTREMKLFACACRKSVIADYKSMMRVAGFILNSAAPTPCAYSGIIADYEKRTQTEGDYCFIDLGYGGTGIYMFNSHNYNTHRSLNISMSDIEMAIVNATGVDAHIAHSYMESNFQGILDGGVCRDVYNAIALEVMKAVNFYNFNNREKPLERVHFCGGGAGIAALVNAITDTIGLETRMLSELMPPCEAGVDPSLFAKAVGIALQN